MNPFNRNLDDVFRMKEVKVIKEGTEYTGVLQRMDWNNKDVLLRDAYKGEEHVGSQYLGDVDNIQLAKNRREQPLHEVLLDNVESHPLAKRVFSAEDNSEFIQTVNEDGHVKSFPEVREIETESGSTKYQVLNGHKRLWVAEKAGNMFQKCRVYEEINDSRALKKFFWSHYPLKNDLENGNDEKYSDEQLKNSIYEAKNMYGEKPLDYYPVEFNVKRLGLEEVFNNDG